MSTRYKFPTTDKKLVDELGKQFEKIIQSANRGSLETRYRYAHAGARFVAWVQPTFKMQKLANLSDKHLVAYAKEMKNRGCSDKYIKNELSALRYIHSVTPNTRNRLSDSTKMNRAAGLGPTPNQKASQRDKSWTHTEKEKMCYKAIQCGHPKIASTIQASYTTGMRLDEAASLRRNDAEKALRTGSLHLTNTKGGRPRDVQLSDRAKEVLSEAIQGISRGSYVFVPENTRVHEFKKDVQNFIYQHRDEIQESDRSSGGGDTSGSSPIKCNLTFHGLRHSYAQNRYEELRDQGYDDKEAREKLTEELGHGRIEITRVYT